MELNALTSLSTALPDLSLISAVSTSALLGAIVVGLTSIVKTWVPERAAPAVPLVIGVAIVFTAVQFSLLGFWAGIALGLVAMGLYDVGSKMILNR